MRHWSVRLRFISIASIVLAPAACGRGAPTLPERPLPSEFSVRSDVPYIRGSIVERSVSASGSIRLLVKAPAHADARVKAALVTVLPDAIIRWENGSHATTDALTPRRLVTVFVTGAELRSDPPQVTGNGFVLHPLF